MAWMGRQRSAVLPQGDEQATDAPMRHHDAGTAQSVGFTRGDDEA